nr:RNA-dependent RNA polymerase [Marmot picobirnavirus]
MDSNKYSTKEVGMGEFFQLPNPNLREYLSDQAAGSSEVIRGTLYGKDSDPQNVLEAWAEIFYAKISKFKDLQGLIEFEEDMRSKVGPMSVKKSLQDRMDSILSYFTMPDDQAEPIRDAAFVAALRDKFNAVRGMRQQSLNKAIKEMKKSTNSGAPFFTKRRVALKMMSQYSISETQQCINGIQYSLAATLGWRGQEGGPNPEDTKQRVLWMFPMLGNIYEATVYNPLINGCQRRNLIPAWNGDDAVDQQITRLFSTVPRDQAIISTDFTAFDQHFNVQLQEAARKLLATLFGDINDWLDIIYPIKYTIPLVIDWGTAIYGRHGMASGSGGTNADETLVHSLLQQEAALAYGESLNPFSGCLGDDGILSFPGITPEKVMKVYTTHGLEMNEQKQYVSTDDCIYLRRWHSRYWMPNGINVGVYSTFRALGRLMFQERWYDPDIWNEKMVALRQLSIIENVRYHPLREEFLKFCMQGDEYRLGIDIPGFLDDIDVIAKEANESLPDFMSYSATYNTRKLSSWWVVQQLKSYADS